MEGTTARWFSYETKHTNALVNLFCFPHAGAGPGVYAIWGRMLSEKLSFYPVNYPMRESRKSEVLPESIQTLANLFAENNKDLLTQKPFVLYGHCMGAVIAYEVAKAAQELWGVEPVLLIASSSAAPDCPPGKRIEEDMDIREIARLFAEMNYIDMAMAGDQTYLEYFISVLKADYLLQQNYTDLQFRQMHCPVYVLYGADDAQIDLQTLKRWEIFTANHVEYECIPGGHFFVDKGNMKTILQVLENRILDCISLKE